MTSFRNPFKNAFWSNLGVGRSAPILEILEYSSGRGLAAALTLDQNSVFKGVSSSFLKNVFLSGEARRAKPDWLNLCVGQSDQIFEILSVFLRLDLIGRFACRAKLAERRLDLEPKCIPETVSARYSDGKIGYDTC